MTLTYNVRTTVTWLCSLNKTFPTEGKMTAIDTTYCNPHELDDRSDMIVSQTAIYICGPRFVDTSIVARSAIMWILFYA